MAGNLGFSQNENLLEVQNGAEAIQNLAGGTVDADLRLFAGSSTRKSKLFWDRIKNTSSITNSPTDISPATRLNFDSDYTYSDGDIVKVNPINLVKDIAYYYKGFDSDGVLQNISGFDISYVRGEDYAPGVYENVTLNGGNGDGGKATIVVNISGEVESVEITNNGTGYIQGDVLTVNSIGSGRGFLIRIIGFPWRAIIVGNSAFDACLYSNSSLSVEIANTNSSLNGTYKIRKDLTTGRNSFYEPNQSNKQAYDVNRLLYAQEKISSNLSLYDIDGDESFTQIDVDLIEIYLNNATASEAVQLSAFDSYIADNPTHFNQETVRRNNSVRIRNYFTGLSPVLYDVDGTGQRNYTVNLLSQYIANGQTLYESKSASSLIPVNPVSPITFTHTNIIEVPIKSNPNYIIDTNEQYSLPYIRIFSEVAGEPQNILDNFNLYGTRQICTTSLNDYLNNVVVGSFNTEFNYRIFRKYTIGTNYFVEIVIEGIGKPAGQPFGVSPQLTPTLSTPVFDSTEEYEVYDSNVIDSFFLKSNPRSSIESNKKLILFSELYQFSPPNNLIASTIASPYAGVYVSVTTLIPDLFIERDDKLELSNVSNLNPPEIVDDGSFPNTLSTTPFSYLNFSSISLSYSGAITLIKDIVDESLYLQTTKYRTDRSLYLKREIKVNGLISSEDPDGVNVTPASILEEKSPGIYISDSTSQLTNELASDFARKTRSFSSNYNPWRDDLIVEALSTGSLNVTINDLVWTTEISLDVGRQGATQAELANMGYETGIVGESLDTNFNQTTVDNGQSWKLKTIINGEVFYIIMKKS